ncbi:UNVERIFIED_CONTAM: hypothetical protein NCL1_36096 [Trichonephila clavipes]
MSEPLPILDSLLTYGLAMSLRLEKTEEKTDLTREHYRTVIFYDFKAELNLEECIQWSQLAFGDESPYRATVFRWFIEFCRCHNCLQDEERTGKLRLAVIPD